MAKIFPPELPDEIRKDPKRGAECRVYDALGKQLDDGFHVFYSSPWLGTNPDGTEIDGEADFVIGHAKYGFLTIEVKGGRISITDTNQWKTKDREGVTYKIKNPVQQARTSKHQLLNKLKDYPTWNDRWVTARHGSRPARCCAPARG